jgi:hypothetical protein
LGGNAAAGLGSGRHAPRYGGRKSHGGSRIRENQGWQSKNEEEREDFAHSFRNSVSHATGGGGGVPRTCAARQPGFGQKAQVKVKE